MPAYYIGEHVVISGTLEGGRRLNWVKTGNSPMSEVSLLYTSTADIPNPTLCESILLDVLCPTVLDGSSETQPSYRLGDLDRIFLVGIRAGWGDRPQYARCCAAHIRPQRYRPAQSLSCPRVRSGLPRQTSA